MSKPKSLHDIKNLDHKMVDLVEKIITEKARSGESVTNKGMVLTLYEVAVAAYAEGLKESKVK